MKKRIFEKDENGNLIINYENIDFDFYSRVAQDKISIYNTLFFLRVSDLENENSLSTELKYKRLIDDKRLLLRVKSLKEDLIKFSERYLKGYNNLLVDEQSEENFLRIMDEYERVLEYKTLQMLIDKKQITKEDFKTLEEKRKFVNESLIRYKKLNIFVASNYELCSFILNNRNYDELIKEEERREGKRKRINLSFHYSMLRKWLTPDEIKESRRLVLEYKRRFKLDNATALTNLSGFTSIDGNQEILKEDVELIKLICKKDREYQSDLKRVNQEKEEAKKRLEDERRKLEEAKQRREQEIEAEKRRKNFEKYVNFEENGTYGPKERVIPIELKFWGKRGKTFTEEYGEEGVSKIFDIIKGIKFRRNERAAIVIYSDCTKDEAIRVLNDLRNQAPKNDFDERMIEGIITEYGEELVFDDKSSRSLVPRKFVEEKLEWIRGKNKEKFPRLKEEDSERSYLTYSLEGFKRAPVMLKKMLDKLGKDIGVIRYIYDEKNAMLYGVTREKYPYEVRKKVAKYLGLKYKIDKSFLDAFMHSKKKGDIEKDKEDEDGEVSL